MSIAKSILNKMNKVNENSDMKKARYWLVKIQDACQQAMKELENNPESAISLCNTIKESAEYAIFSLEGKNN